MKVILIREVKSLGKHDDIVTVNEGYARNYLFPRNLAVEATPANLAQVEKRRQIEKAKGEKSLEQAQELAAKLNEAQITIKSKVGAGSKLYGAVTHGDLAEAIEKQTKIKVDKRKIELDDPIKALGTYEVPVRLHREVVAKVKVEVAAE